MLVGMYWGHLMALVQPERNRTDSESKYNVPKEVRGCAKYPSQLRNRRLDF